MEPALARSRRSVLAAAVGGAAALAAEAIVRPIPAQATSAALMTEVDNPAEAKTSLTAVTGLTMPDDVGFETSVGDLATAIHGDSPNGVGVLGTNDVSGAGVVGNSNGAVGVLGQSGDPSTYPGFPVGPAGVLGYSSVTGQPGVVGLGDVG
ncbi:MAG TPA: hypothetical protein VEG29_03240, partial [Candidatus Binatia bacterium]|nr:hypothetical protein [Candidatus Binatia bacterium]